MKSYVVLSEEIDDVSVAAEELVSSLKEKVKPGKNAAGIVYCDADVEVGELSGILHEKLGIDIVGVTTTASIERFSGYHDMGIVLSIITGDDVEISTGSTGDLDGSNFREKIEVAYKDARSKISEDPKLVLLCSPYLANLTSENYMEVLDEVSGHVPVFGGVATDHYDLQYQKTFCNGEEYSGGVVFLLLSGNVKPVFAMEHSFGGKTEKKGVVTKSTAHEIDRVGDQTFQEYLSDIVPVPETGTVIYHFQSTPFVIEMPDYEESEQPVVRALCTIDPDTGAGGFLSKMPEGSTLSINVLQRDNLEESCNNTMDLIKEKMAQNSDYDYSMMLISTCNARHLLMGDQKKLESEIVTEKLAEFGNELNAAGFYGFGEMCPTRSLEDGEAKNRFHNISFAVCAF